MKIANEIDLRLFQNNLNSCFVLFKLHRYLGILFEKCEHINFTRNGDFIRHPFYIDDEIVETVLNNKNLGIAFY